VAKGKDLYKEDYAAKHVAEAVVSEAWICATGLLSESFIVSRQVEPVAIAPKGRGECDTRGSKDERKVEGESLKSREECLHERMRAKSSWRCKRDEPYRLVDE
jgi:hypothetical protein